MPLLEGWRGRARQLKQETYALYLACRDPETPWFAKVFVAFVVGYALSPIDLIPDFVPVLSYLDDLIIIPLGVAIAVKMIPAPVLDKCRRKAGEELIQAPSVARRHHHYGPLAAGSDRHSGLRNSDYHRLISQNRTSSRYIRAIISH